MPCPTQSSPCTGFQSRVRTRQEKRKKGFYWCHPSSTQALRCSREGWVCGGMQAGCRAALLGWVLSPSARRRPNLPTGLMPRPVYQEGSMSGFLISMERSRRRPAAGRAMQVSSKHSRQVAPSFIPDALPRQLLGNGDNPNLGPAAPGAVPRSPALALCAPGCRSPLLSRIRADVRNEPRREEPRHLPSPPRRSPLSLSSNQERDFRDS